jgi:regulator of sigma E protease
MRVRVSGRTSTRTRGGVILAGGALSAAFLGGTLDYVVSAVVALGALIFIHELGHFLVAKATGVGVERFSLGFGPRIFAFRRGETEYCVSIVPLGGYVKMTGEEAHGEDAIHPATGEAPADPAKSFAAKPLWSRALIVFAGPGMNFVLAAAIYAAVFAIVGIAELPAIVGRVAPDSAGAEAGLRLGDAVVAVDGRPIRFWSELQELVQTSAGRPLALTVRRGGEQKETSVAPRRVRVQAPPLGEVSEVWSLGANPHIPPVVGDVVPGSPAAEAGLQPKDRIVAVDGRPAETWEDLVETISKRPGESLTLTVERTGSRMDLSVTPRAESDPLQKDVRIGRIGIASPTPDTFVRSGPLSALAKGATQTWIFTVLTVKSMWQLVTGRISASNIRGPIQIGMVAGQAAQQGLATYAALVAVISINLAILNLLPVPMLDGGHLLFFAIEAVLGRPLSLRKREIAQQIGLALLLLLMVFALYNDVAHFPAVEKLFR